LSLTVSSIPAGTNRFKQSPHYLPVNGNNNNNNNKSIGLFVGALVLLVLPFLANQLQGTRLDGRIN
jgi:hypothetical protein